MEVNEAQKEEVKALNPTPTQESAILKSTSILVVPTEENKNLLMQCVDDCNTSHTSEATLDTKLDPDSHQAAKIDEIKKRTSFKRKLGAYFQKFATKVKEYKFRI